MTVIGARFASIGENFTVGLRLRLDILHKHNGALFHPALVIGDNVSINDDCHIGCVNEIKIGNCVLIASKVFITDHMHGNPDQALEDSKPSERLLFSKGSVIIEDNVWIGEGVAIMPNVKIGKGAIVGANSVVTKDVPAHSIVAGAPARIIRRNK